MNLLTRFGLARSRFTIMAMIGLLIAGIGLYPNFPKREDPVIVIRTAVVSALFPGMAPERMENLVAVPIERKIRECRVAGNVRNADILGSMEFACKLAGAKVVLVMGHTACGAIKGAIDNAELGNLTGLLAKIKPAVEATTYKGERSAKNYAFVDAVARKNVEMTVAGIRQDSSVLADLESQGAVKMVGGMYKPGDRRRRVLRVRERDRRRSRAWRGRRPSGR